MSIHVLLRLPEQCATGCRVECPPLLVRDYNRDPRISRPLKGGGLLIMGLHQSSGRVRDVSAVPQHEQRVVIETTRFLFTDP